MGEVIHGFYEWAYSFMGDKGPGNQNEGQTANQNRQANIIYSTEHWSEVTTKVASPYKKKRVIVEGSRQDLE